MTAMRHEALIDSTIYDAEVLYYTLAHKIKVAEGRTWNRSEAEIDQLKLEAGAVSRFTVAAMERYKGWSRFFLVTNTNGHIHRSMSCSTCFYSTQFSWLTELSGLTEAEAVAEYGEILCTVCFPSAPVEWTNGTNKKDAERKAQAAFLRAIVKTPEGKRVKTLTERLSSLGWSVSSLESKIRRYENESFDANTPSFVVSDYERAVVELPKTIAKITKVESQLAAATTALDALVKSLDSGS
jgi:hypothetical protein